MIEDEKLQLDYERVVAIFAQLSDIRFKLLGFVPTVSGVALGLIGKAGFRTIDQIGFCALGFLATLGIVFYDQRNTQLYNTTIGRAQYLESRLGLPAAESDLRGGWFNSRPRAVRKFLGLVPMRHDFGLALVYAPVLGAWFYVGLYPLVSRERALAAAAIAIVVLLIEFQRLDRPKRQKSLKTTTSFYEIWCLLLDRSRWRRWNPDISDVSLDSEGEPGWTEPLTRCKGRAGGTISIQSSKRRITLKWNQTSPNAGYVDLIVGLLPLVGQRFHYEVGRADDSTLIVTDAADVRWPLAPILSPQIAARLLARFGARTDDPLPGALSKLQATLDYYANPSPAGGGGQGGGLVADGAVVAV